MNRNAIEVSRRPARRRERELLDVRDLRLTGLLNTLAAHRSGSPEQEHARRDLHLHTALIYPRQLVYLTREDVTLAVLDAASEGFPLPGGGAHIGHIFQRFAEAELALYDGSAAQRFEPLRDSLGQLVRPFVARIQVLRCEALWLRGRLAIAAAANASHASRLLDEVARTVASLDAEKAELARVWASLLQAALHAVRGERDPALSALCHARLRAQILRLDLIATIAGLRIGELLGGAEGARVEATAIDRARALGVQMPTRLADVIAP